MNRLMKFASLGLILGAYGSASAANQIVFSAVGSSAMFNQFEQAARITATATQATNNYRKNASGRLIDGSLSSTGNLWVVWNGTAGNRKIWLYLSTDSTVGVRAYFNSALVDMVANFATTNTGVANGYAQMPQDVFDTIDAGNNVFNAGMTDITPADAKVATQRLFDNGYSPTNGVKGISFTGSGSTTSPSTTTTTLPVDFNLAARAYSLFAVGAAPMMIVINKNDTSLSGIGNLDNINSQNLAYCLDGTFKRTSSINNDAAARNTNKGLVTFLREGLSGTYNTTEYCIPNTVRYQTTQEAGVTGAAATNPLRQATYNGAPFAIATTTVGTATVGTTTTLTATDTGGRVRGIGTNGVLNCANFTTNSLTYAFWAVSQFTDVNTLAPLFPNLKYLTVDGIDPIQDSYTGGNFPLSTSLKNVKNGAYPIWSILRACVPPALINNAGDFRDTFLNATAANNGADVVAKNDLLVFRSYRATADVLSPSNGIVNLNSPEAGADAGGMVFSINNEFDFNLDTGASLINLRQ